MLPPISSERRRKARMTKDELKQSIDERIEKALKTS
jgi:hypothetical protein